MTITWSGLSVTARPSAAGAGDGVRRQHEEVDGGQPLRIRRREPAQLGNELIGARADPLLTVGHGLSPLIAESPYQLRQRDPVPLGALPEAPLEKRPRKKWTRLDTEGVGTPVAVTERALHIAPKVYACLILPSRPSSQASSRRSAPA